MMKRVFIIVLDSFGVGAMPDAGSYGDTENVNTLGTVFSSPLFKADNLISLGLGSIPGCGFCPGAASPRALVGRLAEKSKGKDTTTGHWEIAGLVSENPLPVFPGGFPDGLISEIISQTGRGVLCNKPYSGTEVIRDYGKEHIETGKPIIYTSADSVFQVAAHSDVMTDEELYAYCRTARKILSGKYGVGRVIARPFTGEYPFKRTGGRHDFSLEPFGPTLLDKVKDAGLGVYAIGKINDIFAGRGVTRFDYTASNAEGIKLTEEAVKTAAEGLIFTNLVDFDMVYGHRRDIDGYASAIAEFDAAIPGIISLMRPEDVLVITADHGCDPGYTATTDHTREYVPLIVYGENIKPGVFGERAGFDTVAASVSRYLGVQPVCGAAPVF